MWVHNKMVKDIPTVGDRQVVRLQVISAWDRTVTARSEQNCGKCHGRYARYHSTPTTLHKHRHMFKSQARKHQQPQKNTDTVPNLSCKAAPYKRAIMHVPEGTETACLSACLHNCGGFKKAVGQRNARLRAYTARSTHNSDCCIVLKL